MLPVLSNTELTAEVKKLKKKLCCQIQSVGPKNVDKIWVGTQVQYDALLELDPNTAYIING